MSPELKPFTCEPENFGPHLSEYLTMLGMSQTEFSQRIGVTQAGLSMILNGKRKPGLEMICRILNVVPVQFESLVRPRVQFNESNVLTENDVVEIQNA